MLVVAQKLIYCFDPSRFDPGIKALLLSADVSEREFLRNSFWTPLFGDWPYHVKERIALKKTFYLTPEWWLPFCWDSNLNLHNTDDLVASWHSITSAALSVLGFESKIKKFPWFYPPCTLSTALQNGISRGKSRGCPALEGSSVGIQPSTAEMVQGCCNLGPFSFHLSQSEHKIKWNSK